MGNDGLLAWLGKVTNRHDISLVSSFTKDIVQITFDSEMEVIFSSRISSMIGIDSTQWGTTIGVPSGDFWTEFSKMNFIGFEIVSTPRNLTASHFLRLRYNFTFDSLQVKRSRFGRTSNYETFTGIGSLLFPVSRIFEVKVSGLDVIDFIPMQAINNQFLAIKGAEPLSINAIQP